MTADDAEIIRTSTGSVSFPSLVSLSGQQRLVGEEAAPQVLNPNTLCYLDQLLGNVTVNIITIIHILIHAYAHTYICSYIRVLIHTHADR